MSSLKLTKPQPMVSDRAFQGTRASGGESRDDRDVPGAGGDAEPAAPPPGTGVPGQATTPFMHEALGKCDTLPRSLFVHQIERERRRAERSGSPLSIVVFESEGSVEKYDERLLALIQAHCRQTDLVGDLDGVKVAVLLPDTCEQGARSFAEKLEENVDGLRFRTVTGCYPDHVFESLTTGVRLRAEIQPILLPDTDSLPPVRDVMKRLIDLTVAGVALLLTAPVLMIAAVAVKATSPGPVIFRQVRLGRRGAPFVFYKFRSMYRDADQSVHRNHVTALIDGSARGGGVRQWAKLVSDPRITPVGRILRNTSIDELPQLFNVLKGDMSLIGPRPPVPYEVEKYQPWHLRRILETRPGISGLWQVESRGWSTFDEMVRMDLRYIRTRSLLLDFRILIKTLVVVFRRTGAS